MDIQYIDICGHQVNVWDQDTYPRIKDMIQHYNDLIFDYSDDTRVPNWNAELSYLRSMLEQGQDLYIPF